MTRLLVSSLVVLALAGNAAAADKVPTTRLLFSYAVNAGGFDTGLVISNTSMDPFGTENQNGTCTLSFFGTNAPSPLTTGTIAAGSMFVTLVSFVAPGFTGYLFADCGFNHAHGLTFVSDIGARNIAFGQLAQVVPAKKRRAVKGERLGY